MFLLSLIYNDDSDYYPKAYIVLYVLVYDTVMWLDLSSSLELHEHQEMRWNYLIQTQV